MLPGNSPSVSGQSSLYAEFALTISAMRVTVSIAEESGCFFSLLWPLGPRIWRGSMRSCTLQHTSSPSFPHLSPGRLCQSCCLTRWPCSIKYFAEHSFSRAQSQLRYSSHNIRWWLLLDLLAFLLFPGKLKMSSPFAGRGAGRGKKQHNFSMSRKGCIVIRKFWARPLENPSENGLNV